VPELTALAVTQSVCFTRAVAHVDVSFESQGTVHEMTNDLANQNRVEVNVIREILVQHGRLAVDVSSLDEESDLYSAGLTSLATVGIMLALEDRFDIEFPESMLSRKTFKSVSAIAEAVSNLAS
jgi:acyl carrier protein